MNRADFQTVSDIRVDEANALLAAGRFEGAYYLAGYAVECALKACIAKLTNLHDFPPINTRNSHYTHNLATLLDTANLTNQLLADTATNPALDNNWKLACRWDEGSRYVRRSRQDAEELLIAITDPTNGVLQWLKQRW